MVANGGGRFKAGFRELEPGLTGRAADGGRLPDGPDVGDSSLTVAIPNPLADRFRSRFESQQQADGERQPGEAPIAFQGRLVGMKLVAGTIDSIVRDAAASMMPPAGCPAAATLAVAITVDVPTALFFSLIRKATDPAAR